jgi:hypothetical protein
MGLPEPPKNPNFARVKTFQFTMKRQSYSNHRRYVPGYHFIGLGLLIISSIGSVVNLTESLDKGEGIYSASLILTLHIVLSFLYYYVREFAIGVQNRAIRAEENFRHFVLTGKPLDGRLGMGQIVAVRFAPDDEFAALCKEAAERQLTPDEIKKAITRWKGDYHRI